jgi:divalent metal cation (Fe/Co/Zn/Cd) transporter
MGRTRRVAPPTLLRIRPCVWAVSPVRPRPAHLARTLRLYFRVMSTAEVAVPGSPAYLREARKAKLLSWASLGYMALEGIVAVVAGIVAGSIALIGFGLDSAIEGFASVVIVWRFTGSRTLSERAEHRAQKIVAIQFFILAPYVGVESVRTLIDGSHAEESLVGIALATSSLILMPVLGRAKQRIGTRIGSSATASEGKQNLLCAYLASALLVGLLGNALFSAWWLDPAVGLVIAAVAIQEGREAWRGDASCAH